MILAFIQRSFPDPIFGVILPRRNGEQRQVRFYMDASSLSTVRLFVINVAAGVRTAAIEVMGALYHQVGPKLLAFAISDEVSID
jgi:hypothetical protein